MTHALFQAMFEAYGSVKLKTEAPIRYAYTPGIIYWTKFAVGRVIIKIQHDAKRDDAISDSSLN